MKCPSCTCITSDKRDICPSCGIDLRTHKETLGIPIAHPNLPASELRQLERNLDKAPGASNTKLQAASQTSLRKPVEKTPSQRSWISKLFFKSVKVPVEPRPEPRAEATEAPPLKASPAPIVETAKDNEEAPPTSFGKATPPEQIPVDRTVILEEPIVPPESHTEARNPDDSIVEAKSILDQLSEEPASGGKQTLDLSSIFENVTPEVVEFDDDDDSFLDHLDSLIGDEALDVEALPSDLKKVTESSSDEFADEESEFEVLFEVEDDELPELEAAPTEEAEDTGDDLDIASELEEEIVQDPKDEAVSNFPQQGQSEAKAPLPSFEVEKQLLALQGLISFIYDGPIGLPDDEEEEDELVFSPEGEMEIGFTPEELPGTPVSLSSPQEALPKTPSPAPPLRCELDGDKLLLTAQQRFSPETVSAGGTPCQELLESGAHPIEQQILAALDSTDVVLQEILLLVSDYCGLEPKALKEVVRERLLKTEQKEAEVPFETGEDTVFVGDRQSASEEEGRVRPAVNEVSEDKEKQWEMGEEEAVHESEEFAFDTYTSSLLWNEAQSELTAYQLKNAHEIEISLTDITRIPVNDNFSLLFSLTEEELLDPLVRREYEEEGVASDERELQSLELKKQFMRWGRLAIEKEQTEERARYFKKKAAIGNAGPVLDVVESEEAHLDHAPVLRRLFAKCVDFAAVLLCSVLIALFGILPAEVLESLAAGKAVEIELLWHYGAKFLLVYCAAWFFFSVGALTLSGKTLGKSICGLKVLDADGFPLSLSGATLRTLTEPLALWTLGLGVAPALFGSRRTLSDRLARTQVCRMAKALP